LQVVREGSGSRAQRICGQGGVGAAVGDAAVNRGGAGRVTVSALVVIALAAAAPTASARILNTRPAAPTSTPPALPLGGGFEYETDGEESEYGFPFLAEYGLTDWLKVSAEPSFILIRKKAGGQIASPGDLETTVSIELPTERRYRPGLAFESVVKWPTASNREIGTG